ncbi:hypothetical protein EDC18_101518 [Natranaerovirga pectinivora]|uniref:DUF5673 domain-containing protein n=1 Tax=Natranaerovirga pectinivora TaxID=682400 RepID=A0A4R3MU18_9FIRM|nr:hypothetical protein [Natranaerovirga pectinivora]TCT17220.1 hypothetical protein EDC18_101518 [Natranaerovirga pectinivora]
MIVINFLDVLFTVSIILLVSINLVEIINSRKSGQIVHYYKLKNVTPLKVLRYIFYFIIISLFVVLIVTVINKKEYKVIVQSLFWIIISGMHIMNFPSCYYVTDKGLVKYGIHKCFFRIHRWEDIKSIEWDKINDRILYVYIEENGLRLKINCKYEDEELNVENLKKHLEYKILD